MSHEIHEYNINTRTDLAIERINNSEISGVKHDKVDDINITTITIDENNTNLFNKKNGKYITIEFNDITDFDNNKKVEKVFIDKLNEILKDNNINENNTCLVIGLGNEKVCADSLGPLTTHNIIVTNHYYYLGINVEEGFRSVASITPGVMGQTGLETFDIINSIVKEIKPDFILIIDSLKASNVNKVNKTIQITDTGISPGSGIGNNRKEISREMLKIPVIAIGVPTVVDIITIVNDVVNLITNYYTYMKNNISSPIEKLKVIRTNFNLDEINVDDKKELLGLIGSLTEEEFKEFISEVLIPIGYNMIGTTKDIDLQIDKLSLLLSNGINNSLHKNVTKL